MQINNVGQFLTMSSRGETVFVSTWGSRGSALANKVAFQRIATSNENHVFLAMRLFLHLRYKTLDLLQIHFFYSIYPYCLRAIKSFDREGWVEKSFLPFPKGWSRVVATRRHLNEGAAGKTALHRFITRREASIRRSQRSNSEAVFF